jgi:hypothetical protein
MSGAEIALIGAAALKAGGQIMGGVSAYRSSRLQAELRRREGDQAMQRAQIEQDAILAEGERAIGEGYAAAGASGLDLSGSATDIFGRLAAERSQMASTSLYEGQMGKDAAYQEARGMKKAGDAALISSFMQAGATALSAGSDIAGARSSASAAGQAQWQAQASAKVPPMMKAPAPISLTKPRTQIRALRIGG